MPLLSVKANLRVKSSDLDLDFSDKSKQGWVNFWKSAGGDRDNIINWAKEADIEDPQRFYQKLHRFLFPVASGKWFEEIGEEVMDMEDQSKVKEYIKEKTASVADEIYNEYLLAMTQKHSEDMLAASDMNKKACMLEKLVGIDSLLEVKEGDKVRHIYLDDKTFTVKKLRGDSTVELEDDEKKKMYTSDIWNLVPVVD